MRTAIYIDGYNFYYGLLKYTPYKWLNIRALLDELLHEQSPRCSIQYCGFYTAMTSARMATKGQRSVQAQQVYHRALLSPYTPEIRVISHHHDVSDKYLPAYVDGNPPDKNVRARVWLMTEKKTDVCLSLDAYRAAASGTCEQIVVVSNDTDFEPLLQALREDFPQIVRGVVVPRRNTPRIRPPSAGLNQVAT